MQAGLETLIQDLSDKVNLLRTADENRRSLILSDLVQNINNLSESRKSNGIPPPRDDISMCSSIRSKSESLSEEEIEEINHYESVSDIRNCNKEMKSAVKESIGVFQSASRELLNKSINGDKTTVIVKQLNSLKKELAEAIEESRGSRNSFVELEDGSEVKEMQEVFKKIERIQEEIEQAGKMLKESEDEIVKTDKENLSLKEQLMKLEGNLGMVLEVEEDAKKGACGCEVC